MKKLINLAILLMAFNSANAQNIAWNKVYNQPGGISSAEVLDMATDANKNIYITGVFQDTIDLGNGTTPQVSKGGTDIFVAKMDSVGNALWVRTGGGNDATFGYDKGFGIGVDAQGNSYVTGIFRGTAIFDTSSVYSAANYPLFLAKYNTSGTLLWLKTYSGLAAMSGMGAGLKMATINGIEYFYISGTLSGGANLDGHSISEAGQGDVFLAMFNTSGIAQWAIRAGSPSFDLEGTHAIGVGVNGDVYFAGHLQGTATIGTATSIPNTNSSSMFIAKIDSTGNVIWAKGSSGGGGIYPNAIVTDNSGNVYMGGNFANSLTIGSTTLTSAGGGEIFIAKYDVSGNVVWAIKEGGSGSDDIWDMEYNNASNTLLVAGRYQNSGTFGSTTISSTNGPGFLAAYSDANVFKYVVRNPFPAGGNCIAPQGNAILTGGVYGLDPFIVKWVSPQAPVAQFSFNSACQGASVSFTDNSSDLPTSWNWNFGDGNTSTSQNPNHVYAAAGNYNVILIASNAQGSDTAIQVVSVNPLPSLTISPSSSAVCSNSNTSVTITVSGANTYSWSTGATSNLIVVTPGVTSTYTVSGLNSFGCSDSVSTTIIVNPNPAANFNASATCLNDATNLINTSTGAGSYSWDFGDGSTSSLQNPSHIYGVVGAYNVLLIATSVSGCIDSTIQSINILSLPTVTAISSVNTICAGSGETVTLTATGTLTYNWSSGSSGSVVNVNPVTTTNYSVIGTDANGCADTAFVTVNVNMIQSLFLGDIFFRNNGTPVNVNSGKVYIYNVDSVGWIGASDSANIISGGSFDMGSVPYGNYKIYITPDKIAYPFLANTYYDLIYTWDDASVVQFTCADTTYRSVELDSISPLTGGFTVGGVIRADSSFTGKVTVQGDPVPGVDVALEQNPGSVMLATTTTDNNGQFTFNNIPATPIGSIYTIIANIPGFGLDSSYNVMVTGNEDNYDYFVSDSTIYIDSVLAATFNSVKHIDKVNESTDFKAYPNPYKNGTTISFELKERSNVSLEIYNALGEKVAVLENTVKEAGVYRYSYSSKSLGSSNGIYFAKLKVNNSLSVAKLIEIE